MYNELSLIKRKRYNTKHIILTIDLLVPSTIVLLRCRSVSGIASAMQSHRLVVLGRAALVASCFPPFSNYNGCDVGDPCDGREYAVHDWAVSRIIG